MLSLFIQSYPIGIFLVPTPYNECPIPTLNNLNIMLFLVTYSKTIIMYFPVIYSMIIFRPSKLKINTRELATSSFDLFNGVHRRDRLCELISSGRGQRLAKLQKVRAKNITTRWKG